MWEINSQRVEKTLGIFPRLTATCESALNSEKDMSGLLRTSIEGGWGVKKLPPFQQFVSIYFSRNNAYLRSAYFLACVGFCGPSKDLQRTVYETLLKGYLFIVNNKEADLMYSYLNKTISSKELKKLRRRKFWLFSFLIGQLYIQKTRKIHKKLYEKLSRFSHPSIFAVLKDLEYSESEVEDCLKTNLFFTYCNIQMMAEGFFDLLNPSMKKKVKEVLFEIADYLGEIPTVEPDMRKWSIKINLRSGNFLGVLK
jgi:hypothetical protein